MIDYPPIVLEHLETLTDRTGVIQHAIFSIPNRRTGYTTDDNARALLVALQEYERTGDRRLLRLVSTYLSFLHYAQTSSRRFHNFMSFDQIFLDDEGSEDCFARVLWACGEALATNIHENVKRLPDACLMMLCAGFRQSVTLEARRMQPLVVISI
ncbi:MAG TPA: hypothetical protein PLZ21_08015 [Armatimonadota bacterium]|nr:hypothetical protein [Armatimonadota bacterium]